jgi:hypothetical protein
MYINANITSITRRCMNKKQIIAPESTDNLTESYKNVIHKVSASFPEILDEAIEKGIETKKGDFFIEVLVQSDKITKENNYNVFIRNICPNPHYSQAVYWYKRRGNQLKTLWLIASQVQASLYALDKKAFPAYEKQNIQYVMDYHSGKLQKMADEYNKKQGKR